MADIDHSTEVGVGTIVFNRPDRKNAFTLEMFGKLADLVRGAQLDPEVSVLVITGAGQSFCAGVDLDAFFDRSEPSPYDNKALLTGHVFDDDEFDDHVTRFAQRLTQSPPLMVRLIKRATIDGEHMTVRGALDLISSHQAVVQSTQNSVEAVAAMREHRPPVFHGC